MTGSGRSGERSGRLADVMETIALFSDEELDVTVKQVTSYIEPIMIVFLAAIVGTIVLFWRHNKWAGMMLLPYIAWVTFATALNFAIWQMNA